MKSAKAKSVTSTDARLARVLATARVMLWEYDLRSGRIHYDIAAEVSGALPLPPALCLRQALRLVHAEDRREVIARARAAIEHRCPYVQHFRVILAGSGAPPDCAVWVEHHGAVTCDGDEVCSLVGTMVDITAHKQALDALAVADRRKDDFMASLAHELRNPLTAISAAAKLLRSVSLQPQQISSCVDIIHRQAGQLGRLVEDLLDLSHIVRNRLELKRQRTDLRDAIRSAAEAVGELLRARDHRLHLALPEEPLTLDADPVRLSQLFGNLLTNAAKYTPRSGQIEVCAESGGGWAIVHVRDTGLGIAAEHLAHVFEPFFQADRSLAHASGGLGIGLALVRRIAQLHGGSVSVHSEGGGRGSEFTVRLPLMTAPRAAVRGGVGGGARAPRSERPLRILVAEDNADVAETLALSLQMLGHDVRVALDGEEALRLAEEFRPQAALLDVGMPKRDGHEVAREIRARPWAAQLGVLLVALTGWNARELQDRIDMSAFDVSMVKPLDLDAVRQILGSAQHHVRSRLN